MMATAENIKREFSKLTVVDQLELLYELWDALAQQPDALTLSDEQKRELDRRYEHHLAHPEEAIPWEEVRDRLLRNLDKS
ncbi:MAG: addiction module protein [Deltaproteobacteria bacterium]|nr:addiction module protein [Deltaproteobacteria bacterium]